MDLEKPIRKLYSENQELERVIAELEELYRATGPVVSSNPGGRHERVATKRSFRADESVLADAEDNSEVNDQRNS